jgi:hypothetical protein
MILTILHMETLPQMYITNAKSARIGQKARCIDMKLQDTRNEYAFLSFNWSDGLRKRKTYYDKKSTRRHKKRLTREYHRALRRNGQGESL